MIPSPIRPTILLLERAMIKGRIRSSGDEPKVNLIPPARNGNCVTVSSFAVFPLLGSQ